MKLGLVLVINEIDRGRAGDLVALNDALDGGNLVIKETGEVIEPHPKFRLICTANSAGSGDMTGQYVGSVRKLDPAFLDRFAMIKVGYMDTADELDLLMLKFPDYARKSSVFLKNFVQFAAETRAKAIDVAENLSNPISTRAVMRTLNLGRSMGLLKRIGEPNFSYEKDLLPVLDLAYLNRLSADEREAARHYRQTLLGLILAHFYPMGELSPSWRMLLLFFWRKKMSIQTTVLDKIAIVDLGFSIWTGAKALEPSDFVNVDVDDLPSSRGWRATVART